MPNSNVKKSWFKMQANEDGKSADISITNEIGYWGVTAAEFIQELKDLGDVSKINLYIMSPGGSVIEGNAIFNALNTHPAEITVQVDFAASMASIIAMTGKTVTIAENGYLMIHNPRIDQGGEASDLRKMADLLDNMKQNAIIAYSSHTSKIDAGKTQDEIAQMMDEATWMTGKQAVEFGFAEKVGPMVQAAASFDLSAIDNVPEDAKKFFAMIKDGEGEEEEGKDEESSNQDARDGDEISDGESEGEGNENGDGEGENVGEDDNEGNEEGEDNGDDAGEGDEDTEPEDNEGDAPDNNDEPVKGSELDTLREQLNAMRDEVALRDEQLKALMEKQKQDSERIEQLIGGFKFVDSEDVLVEQKQLHKFLKSVNKLVDEGMDYGTALISAKNANPELYAEYLRDNKTN